jgi:hypothetical protein
MKLLPLLCGLTLCTAFHGAMADEPLSAPSTAQVIPAPNTPDGFTIANGRVYFIRNGKMIPLQQEVVLRVSPNGTITAFDGTTYVIPRGQVLTLSAGVAALSSAGQAVTNGGAAAATNQPASNEPQAPGPVLSTSPFTRFHPAADPQTVNPQLTYPVPNDSPFTRFHQPAVPPKAGSGGSKDVPNNAPAGVYK